MKLTVLVDNNTLIDRYFKGEPGLSFLLETKESKILFDTGYSDIFIENANILNKDLLDLDYIVLSHGHMDHTWGLEPLIRKYVVNGFEKVYKEKIPTLVSHPLVFKQKYDDQGIPIGINIDKSLAESVFKMNLSKEAVWLTDDLVFLGEIPRTFSFEANEPIGTYDSEKGKVEDFLYDDTALVYKSLEGLVIITGCSHAGICNIVDYAKKVTGIEKIATIIGGFHLLSPSREKIESIKEYFFSLKMDEIYPCHCTDLKSKLNLAKIVDIKEVGAGMELEF